MSRPKELNFFVAELNWDLGPDWYASHFDAAAGVRGETSPHYTNLPRFAGVAERIRDLLPDSARVIYMVRDPIDRMLSHYLHNVGGGYEARPLEGALADPESAYVARGRYAMQAEPYLREFGAERLLIVSREELAAERRATMRRVFGFCGVDPSFDSSQFEREWETGSGKSSGDSGSWTAPCGSPGCAPSIATSTACRSRFAGWSSAWSTIRTPAPHRSRRSTRSSTTASRAFSATTSPSSSGSRAAASAGSVVPAHLREHRGLGRPVVLALLVGDHV